MKLEKLHSVYFVGIGGIGMSALAHWFLAKGYKVAGYDKTPSYVTKQLEQKGAVITFDDALSSIPTGFYEISEGLLVVFTLAIPASHAQLNYYKNNGARLFKRSQVLGLLSENYKTLAIAGTHGKTTTTSLLAHIVYQSGKSMVAFLGGLLQNYDSNFLLNIKEGEETYVVVEADEFDRSFLTLYPTVAVVTNIDPDHLDIYGDEETFVAAFNQFVSQIKPAGKLFKQLGVGNAIPVVSETYGLKEGDRTAQNIRFESGRSQFDYCKNGEVLIADVAFKMPGYHNVLNATAAISVALEIGITPLQIKEALASFGGVKRRFEFIFESEEVVYVDDYAHHPTELKALLAGVRAFWPSRKITILFQPHLFSRTRDFMQEFATSLALADEVVLLDIYPAREESIEGITSEALLALISASNKKVLSKQEAVTYLATQNGVVLTVGAGDIDRLIEPLKNALEARLHV